MEWPYYACSATLVQHWTSPMETAGFCVEPVHPPPRELDGASSPNLIESLTFLHYRWCTIGVHIQRVGTSKKITDQFKMRLLWPPYKAAGDELLGLAGSIDRILLRSGARKSGKSLGCQALYDCPEALAQRWMTILADHGVTVAPTRPDLNPDTGEFRIQPVDASGTVSASGGVVYVFTGHGIDAERNQLRPYIALDCPRSWSGSPAQSRALISYLDRLLVDAGARRCEIAAPA
jgi:hypothetical protein